MMPTLLQLAYLGGYRDGLLRAETLLLSSVPTEPIEVEVATRKRRASTSCASRTDRSSPLVGLTRPGNQD
jgi:hypothetical protein